MRAATTFLEPVRAGHFLACRKCRARWFVAPVLRDGGRGTRRTRTEKIARNPTNRESLVVAEDAVRTRAPYRSASRRGRQFCFAALRISSFSVMRFLVSPLIGRRFGEAEIRRIRRDAEMGESAANKDPLRRFRRCPTSECSLLLSNPAPRS